MMKNALHGLLSLVLVLSLIVFSIPATSAPVAAKSYGSWQVLMAFDIDLAECWGRPLHEAWYTCDEWAEYTSGKRAFNTLTARTIEYVWPRTVSYTEFSVPVEGSLLMEVVLEKDAKHNGWLGYDIQRYDDASAKWVSAGWYWKTVVSIDNGKQVSATDTQYDLGLLGQDGEGKPWHPVLKNFPLYPAGKYRLFAFEPVWGQLDAYQPARGSFTIVYMTKGPPCACVKKDVCKDSDGDGVQDWQDLCPSDKGTISANGCATASWLNALTTDSEKYAREHIKKFLSCQNTIDADKVSKDLKFDYNGNDPEYDKGVLRIGGAMFKAFWRAEKDAECTGKAPSMKQGETIYGLLYHELGHYIVDAADVADVTGAGDVHDPWKESNPGKAFDEGRADLIMTLMARYFNRETKEESGYGFAAYQGKIGSQNPNIVGDAVASMLIDLMPSDPCEALKAFMLTQANFAHNQRPPQNIQDWLKGYNNYIYDQYTRKSSTLAQYVQADTRIGETCKKYGINLPVASPYKCVSPEGISGVELNADGTIKKYILNPQVNNIIGFEGEACTVEVPFAGAPLKITPHSDFEVEIAAGNVTVKVNKGSVVIVTPDNRQVTVQQGGSFNYKDTGTGGKGAGSGTGTDSGTGTTLPANSSVLRDYDKSGDSFSFAKGKTCPGCKYSITDEDFFIADRGAQSIIHAFESPGVIDMGAVSLESVKEAPASGYQDSVAPAEGHTYVFKSRGKYGKIYINDILQPPARDITEYEFKWAFQPNGTRTFADSSSAAQPKDQQPKSGSTTTAQNPLLKQVSKFCPISTAYGSTDAPQLSIFRQFRDKVLAKTAPGKELISVYYAASPAIVEMMNGYGFLVPAVRYGMAGPAALVLNSTALAWNN
jgi:hypothetical protein